MVNLSSTYRDGKRPVSTVRYPSYPSFSRLRDTRIILLESGTSVIVMNPSCLTTEDLIISSDSTITWRGTIQGNILTGRQAGRNSHVERSFETTDFNVTGQVCRDLHENLENSREGEGEFSPDLYTRLNVVPNTSITNC